MNKHRFNPSTRNLIAGQLLENFCSQVSESQTVIIQKQAERYEMARREMLNSLGELNEVIHEVIHGKHQ